jgi:hypothetical protein
MARNLDNRVDTDVPIKDLELCDRIDEILETLLADNRRGWKHQSDWTYQQLEPSDEVIDAQQRLMAIAEEEVASPIEIESGARRGRPASHSRDTEHPFPRKPLDERIEEQIRTDGV